MNQQWFIIAFEQQSSGNLVTGTRQPAVPYGIPGGEVYLKLTVIDDVLIVSFKELWT